MAGASLLINLRCATDLKNVNLVSKMEVYALVSISGGDSKHDSKIKTPTDRDGGSNPTWDYPITFAVEEAALHQDRLTLQFKLVCERALGDKDVGQVRVSVKDLLDSPAMASGGGWRFVSYQVTKPSGRPKGHLTFSYKFSGENENTAKPSSAVKVSEKSTAAYPVVELDSDEVNLPATKVNEEPKAAHPVVKFNSNSVYPPPALAKVYDREELTSSSVYPPPAKIYPVVEFDFNSVYPPLSKIYEEPTAVQSNFNSVYPPANTVSDLDFSSVYPPAAKIYPEMRIDSNAVHPAAAYPSVYPAGKFPQIPLYRTYTFPETFYTYPAPAPAVYPASGKNKFSMELPATDLLA